MNLKELEKKLDEYRIQKDFKNIKSTSLKLYQEAKKQNQKYFEVVGGYHYANMHYIEGNYTEALKLATNTLQLSKFIDVPFYEMVLNNLVGILYGSLDDKITSIEYELKAYYIALEFPTMDYIYIIENNLGVLFFNEHMYETAFNYFYKSIRRRNIDDFNNIAQRDGYNIVNLIGCCVKMKNKREYDYWYPYLEYYLTHFDEPIIHDDALLYDIYQLYFQRDIENFKIKIENYLVQSQKNKNRLHTLKNLNDIFEMVIKEKIRPLCIKLYSHMKEIIEEYPAYKNISKLNDLRIQMDLAFDMEENMQDILYQYYMDKKKEDKQWRESIKKSLSTKVELEETLHKQKKIMKMNEDLMKSSEIEDFTKVFNKTAFRKHVEQDLKHYKNDQYMALFVIDLDKFKQVNDLFGHLTGDQLLLDAVDTFHNDIRKNDYIGRVGGDEFCIFMKNILSIEYIKEKAEMLLKDVRNIQIDDGNLSITTSIGIMTISSSIPYDDLFKEADRLMYEAKNSGGNQYQLKIE